MLRIRIFHRTPHQRCRPSSHSRITLKSNLMPIYYSTMTIIYHQERMLTTNSVNQYSSLMNVTSVASRLLAAVNSYISVLSTVNRSLFSSSSCFCCRCDALVSLLCSITSSHLRVYSMIAVMTTDLYYFSVQRARWSSSVKVWSVRILSLMRIESKSRLLI